MTFGCTLPTRGALATTENIRTLATKAEDLGLDHIWVSDHIVIPNQVSSPYPYSPTGASPFAVDQPYCEALTALSYLAGCTSRVKLGTHVLILPYREPVLTAKTVATLDYMSGGRVILGIGVGWMEEEFKALGLDTFHDRGLVTNEDIQIFKELWTKDNPEFEGRFSQFSGISFNPKPVQNPHPPIWVGGHTVPAIKRAARLGNGWMPIGHRPPAVLEPEEMAGHVDQLRDLTEAAGRPRDDVEVVFSTSLAFDPPSVGPRRTLTGNSEEIAGDIVMYQQVGVQNFILSFQGNSPTEIIENMERFVKEVRPQVV